MAFVWYFLIHASLGLIGWKVFTFTGPGVLAAVAVCAGAQAWPMYEIYRLSWQKFDGARPARGEARRQETRAYWIRMARLYVFRVSAFALLTLFVAWLMRS